ncbi:hypothetical protein [Lactiplantibacillus carotarum]|uniref:hypothetical protein n=1 Tax=Lactiplantibacillus carotarum TaxID=2993456 RepID=UPI00298EFC17|nr:hypothetical protein [Lactiplantibacillus carotarum]
MEVTNYTDIAPDKTFAKPHFNESKSKWEDLAATDMSGIQEITSTMAYQSMINNDNYQSVIAGLGYQLMSGGNN